MIGVVLGHSITALKAGSNCDVRMHVFIRTYDMPFFAFISGVFLRKSCEKHNTFENVFNKVTSIPYDPDFLGWFIAPTVAVVSVAVCWLIREGFGKIPFVGDFIFGGTAASWKKRFKK